MSHASQEGTPRDGAPPEALAPGASSAPAGTGTAGSSPTRRIPLVYLAHARSGDKGDTANVGVIAYDASDYPLLREALGVERVKQHFGPMVKGAVERFELPKLGALNFLLHGALGGGGTVSLMTDAQGKVFSTALLRMEVEVPAAVAERALSERRGRVPPDFDPDRPVPLSPGEPGAGDEAGASRGPAGSASGGPAPGGPDTPPTEGAPG